jgi:hypothetical protein
MFTVAQDRAPGSVLRVQSMSWHQHAFKTHFNHPRIYAFLQFFRRKLYMHLTFPLCLQHAQSYTDQVISSGDNSDLYSGGSRF